MSGSGPDVAGQVLQGRALHSGDAEGPVLRLSTPVSFWGGMDLNGRIIDVHHPQCGRSVTGTVLVMASGRGSSSSTAVLAEQIRARTAPAALVLAECDTILVIAALVAAELYDVHLPILVLAPGDLDQLTGGTASVTADARTLAGQVRLREAV
jgi:uncharacterized protein